MVTVREGSNTGVAFKDSNTSQVYLHEEWADWAQKMIPITALISYNLGMVDPAAAGGGVIAICLVVILPLSLFVHIWAKELIFLSIPGIPVIFTLILYFCGSFTDNGNPRLRELNERFAWWSFWPALIASTLAAVPVVVYRVYRHFRPLDRQRREN